MNKITQGECLEGEKIVQKANLAQFRLALLAFKSRIYFNRPFEMEAFELGVIITSD